MKSNSEDSLFIVLQKDLTRVHLVFVLICCCLFSFTIWILIHISIINKKLERIENVESKIDSLSNSKFDQNFQELTPKRVLKGMLK